MAVRTAVAARPLPAPARPGPWWSLSARAFRCWLTGYRRTWRSSIWSSVFSPLFFLGAMGYGLGSLVNKHGTASLGGVSYVAFLAPAMLAANAMMTAIGEATFPVYGSIKWNKIYVAAQPTPLRPADIFRGHLAFMLFRITLNTAWFMVVMAAFGAVRSAWVVLALPVATLTGLAFAAPITAWAVTLQHESAFSYVFRLVMIPLMLFSGTFFPLSRLPGWLHPVAFATPLWHGVSLCRALSLGHPDPLEAAGDVGYLAVLAAAGIWAGAHTYRRRLYL